MPPKLSNKNYHAYATLVAVMALLTVSTLISVGLLFIRSQELGVTKLAWERQQAAALANSCANIAINNLKLDNAYAGNVTVNIGSYSCQILAVLGTGNTNRTVNTQSQVGDSLRKVQVVITTVNPLTDVLSWREVSAH